MQEPLDLTPEAVDRRLGVSETGRDEDRLDTLEELHNDLESALAEIEGDQTGSPGR